MPIYLLFVLLLFGCDILDSVEPSLTVTAIPTKLAPKDSFILYADVDNPTSKKISLSSSDVRLVCIEGWDVNKVIKKNCYLDKYYVNAKEKKTVIESIITLTNQGSTDLVYRVEVSIKVYYNDETGETKTISGYTKITQMTSSP